ncbi:MAG: hypothetical protein JWN34_3850 [Bryobacterales bacterium]|nr:hypothetical protein [Bryobacterales bacterium]
MIMLTLLTVPGSVRAQVGNFKARSEFESAAVKTSVGCDGGPRVRPAPGRLSIECMSLRSLTAMAYGIFAGDKELVNRTKVVGGPKWIDTERFAISAKSADRAQAWQTMAMLQTLLEDRFQLKTHRESRPAQVYALVIAKGGAKLTAAEPCLPADNWALPERPAPGVVAVRRCGSGKTRIIESDRVMEWVGVTIDEFAARSLTPYVDRAVLNKTDLSTDSIFDWSSPHPLLRLQ